MLKKIAKYLVVVLIWIVIAVAIIGGAALIGYEPMEDPITLFIGLFVGWYAIRFLWRFALRVRAKQRVEQLVNIEEPTADSKNFAIGLRWWQQATETELRFKSILSFIKSSALREYGDPLYVLPWYFVLGDEESRQDDLFKSLNLPSPTIDSETLNSDNDENNWHLLNDSLLIEIPDNYRVDSSQGAKPEWVELLTLLGRHRSAEPINGVIITVSANSLLNKKYDEIAAQARTYRRLLEDTQQVLDTQVPINVVVTGLDKLSGVSQVLDSMTANQLLQVLGQPFQVGQSLEGLTTEVVGTFSGFVHQRALELLRENQASTDLLKLPQKLDDLSKALSLYTRTLFDENLYAHTPDLSGIYMSACYQAGCNDRAETVFVHDLFTNIIPRQRTRITKLGRTKKKQVKERRRLLAAGGAATAMSFALLFTAYQYHTNYIDSMLADYYQNYDSDSTLAASVNNLLLYERVIDLTGRTTWAPWYYTLGRPAFIDAMKADLAKRVEENLMVDVDHVSSRALQDTYFREGELQDTVDFLSILVRRINILKALSNGANEEKLAALPAPYDTRSIGVEDEALVKNINALYLKGLVWDRASQGYRPEMTQAQLASYQIELNKILSTSKNSLNWLVGWANNDRNLKSYSVGDAWVGSALLKKNFTVERAYTVEGKNKIDGFIQEVQQALDSSDQKTKEQIKQLAGEFEDSYKRRYLGAWRRYADELDRGMTTLRGRSEWVDVANNLGSGRNVYFQALNLIHDQLDIFKSDEPVPDWVAMIRYYQQMRILGPDDQTENGKRDKIYKKMLLKGISKVGPLGKVLAKQGKSAMKTQKKLEKAGGGASVVDLRAQQIEEASKLLGDYRAAISDFVYNSEIKSVSFKSVSETFATPDNPSSGEGAYAKAYGAVQSLQSMVGKKNAENSTFWNLYMGSLDFMLAYMIRESSCYVNDYWRNEFLADLETVPKYKKSEYLLGASGTLWSLLDTTMNPFVTRRLGAGFVPTKVDGQVMGLSSQFFSYITKASEVRSLPDSYTIGFKAKPTSVNADAIHLVEETTVTLICSDGSQRLVNQNFDVSNDFVWSDQCSDTTLSLSLGHMTVQKHYSGSQGFVQFLQEFRTGKQRFVPSDFSKEEQDLRGFGIKYIDVEFEVSSAQQLIEDQTKRPPSIPQNISECKT